MAGSQGPAGRYRKVRKAALKWERAGRSVTGSRHDGSHQQS